MTQVVGKGRQEGLEGILPESSSSSSRSYGSYGSGGVVYRRRDEDEDDDEEEEGDENGDVDESPTQRPQLSAVSHLFAGGVAGAISKSCTAPLSRLTILFQVHGMHTGVGLTCRPTILQEASRIAFEEGIMAFWRGNTVTILHRLPYSAINFFAHEKYKKCLIQSIGINSLQDGWSVGMGTSLLAGGAAGITAASLTYPLDLVRTRLTVQMTAPYYKGITHTILTILREEGVSGLYKGLGPTLMAVGPSLAITFCAYESLKSFWIFQRPETPTAWVSLGSGSAAGFISSTATFPVDLVRRRMQLEGSEGRARVYKAGLVGAFQHIFKTKGWRGFYAGIVTEYVKVVPNVGIIFFTYEFMKKCLSQ